MLVQFFTCVLGSQRRALACKLISLRIESGYSLRRNSVDFCLGHLSGPLVCSPLAEPADRGTRAAAFGLAAAGRTKRRLVLRMHCIVAAKCNASELVLLQNSSLLRLQLAERANECGAAVFASSLATVSPVERITSERERDEAKASNTDCW